MTRPAELEAKFWKALKSDMTMMLGIAGVDEAHTRPMTAQLEGDEGGPIWFFTARDNDLVRQLRGSDRAVATFASRDHDLFAAVHGSLRVDTDRAVVDRLWNRFVAAWYEGGKDDPKLALLRLDPDSGQVWADASSFRRGRQDAARLRSEAGLQGQGREGRPGLGSIMAKTWKCARRETARISKTAPASVW